MNGCVHSSKEDVWCSAMILLCVVLCVIFSGECTRGEDVPPRNISITDEAFKELNSSLYCAPNGTFVFHASTSGWLTFASETLPSKYELPVCTECPVCTGDKCPSCVPRPLGASCHPCVEGKPWPSEDKLSIIKPRCLGCLFGWKKKKKIKVKPCKEKKFDWWGWIKAVGKDILCILDKACGKKQPVCPCPVCPCPPPPCPCVVCPCPPPPPCICVVCPCPYYPPPPGYPPPYVYPPPQTQYPGQYPPPPPPL